jgi:hypothetical protein
MKTKVQSGGWSKLPRGVTNVDGLGLSHFKSTMEDAYALPIRQAGLAGLNIDQDAVPSEELIVLVIKELAGSLPSG